jgi:hypothetical protein
MRIGADTDTGSKESLGNITVIKETGLNIKTDFFSDFIS